MALVAASLVGVYVTTMTLLYIGHKGVGVEWDEWVLSQILYYKVGGILEVRRTEQNIRHGIWLCVNLRRLKYTLI